jgi:peptidylprolyl isomerase
MRTRALLLALTTTPLLAQTTPTHTTTTAARRPATASTAGACAHLPELSSKIPALPAGTPCPRPLFTVTRVQPIHADYISPLVSPDLRAVLDPPSEVISLVYADVKTGTGPLVEHGKYTDVVYTGYLADGTIFDSNNDRTKPFNFPLGGHRVIPGWDMGLEGMRVGGKRRLFIPYTLAYGEQGRPPKIPPKSMLIFDIEVLNQTAVPPAGALGTQPVPNRPLPRPTPPAGEPGGAVPQGATAPSSPAGAAAPPPVNSTTPSTSTQPAPPSTPAQPKQ